MPPMTLTINLDPETESGLLDKVQARGILPGGFVKEIVAREVKSGVAKVSA